MKSKHTERTIYLVSVLWCHGGTESEISSALQRAGQAILSKGSVSGILNRAFDGSLRGLTQVERQDWLDRFREQRLDGGYLSDKHFRARVK